LVTIWDLADIRNKAAHGKWDEFKTEDASEMVNGVRRLLTDYLGSYWCAAIEHNGFQKNRPCLF